MTSSPRRLLAGAVIGVLTLVGVVTVPAHSARAIDLRLFDPGQIISDTIFYDTTTMSTAAIQSFLDQKGASCGPAADGTACLKDYRVTTTDQAANAQCQAYSGVANERASAIVAKVATACGINPQVLLVTLQKEQSLITRTTAGSAAVYRKAMGYGCPDTAVCDTQYYGLQNQLYSAARQFQRYADYPTSYSYVAGRVNQVRYSPNASCGSSAVYLQNQATTSLYNYTPYQPNAALLNGQPDGCSSYGNLNFFQYFSTWFGSPTQRPPFGSLDTVSHDDRSVTVAGWALDPDTTAPIQVHVYIDSTGTATTANGDRPDVAAAFGKGAAHGFTLTVPASTGSHNVCVYAIDPAGGTNPQIACRTVVVTNSAPIGALDLITHDDRSITVAGWALDPDTTAPIQVHVYIDSTGTAITADGDRPDVGTAFGRGSAHGFYATLPTSTGTHQVCVYGIDSDGGPNPQIACRSVDVRNHAPMGSLDLLAHDDRSITVAGWVLDPDTTASTQVQITVDGTATTGTASGDRPDVAAAFGLGSAHGFYTRLPEATGEHHVCVTALDSDGGPSTTLSCQDVTVVNQLPIGSLDRLDTTGGQVVASGWALDPDTSDPIQVLLYIDDAGTTVTAAGDRPDVAAAFGKGSAHGFTAVMATSAGSHRVCVDAIDSYTGPIAKLDCRTVTVTAGS